MNAGSLPGTLNFSAHLCAGQMVEDKADEGYELTEATDPNTAASQQIQNPTPCLCRSCLPLVPQWRPLPVRQPERSPEVTDPVVRSQSWPPRQLPTPLETPDPGPAPVSSLVSPWGLCLAVLPLESLPAGCLHF